MTEAKPPGGKPPGGFFKIMKADSALDLYFSALKTTFRETGTGLKRAVSVLFSVVGVGTITAIGLKASNFYFFSPQKIEFSMWGERFANPIPVPWGEQTLLFALTNNEKVPVVIENLSLSFDPSQGVDLIANENAGSQRIGTSNQSAPIALTYQDPTEIGPGAQDIRGLRYRADRSSQPFQLHIGFTAKQKEQDRFIDTVFPRIRREYHLDYSFVAVGVPAMSPESRSRLYALHPPTSPFFSLDNEAAKANTRVIQKGPDCKPLQIRCYAAERPMSAVERLIRGQFPPKIAK